MFEQALHLLKKYYGYDSFRKGQERIIASILSGHDVLGIMPTGGGKSICYQIPALLLPGVTLVISPLISLMKDQVDTLTSLDIPATFINSSLTQSEAEERMEAARHGAYKLIYVAPERLDSERFRSQIQELPISMIAIDEAHCISQWGHDFRPSYLAVPKVLDLLPVRPLVTAFTATATTEVTRDIVELLGIDPTYTFVTGFNRENLTFKVLRGENKRDFVLHYLHQFREQAGIIYAATRKEVDTFHAELLVRGFAVGKYHAGLSDAEKSTYQEQFLYDDIRIMVATNAFGMGIDKSNVRFVLHVNLPKNMESYYQEAGRAGRDGEPSECILLYHPQDVQLQKFLIEQSVMAQERKGSEYKKLQSMVDFAHTTRCLRNYILEYFDDEAVEPCGVCSNCKDDSEEKDITVEAQKIFSCIYRMKERFGASLVAQVLKGSSNKKVLQFGFDKLPTYGLMKTYKEKEITDLIHVLIAEGYLGLTDGQYPVVRLESKAGAVLKGQAQILQKIRLRPTQAPSGDSKLFEQLRELRKEISQREKVPPYIIFSDSTLREMSDYCPTDEAGLLTIKGVGEGKLVRYGKPFLELLQAYAKEHGASAAPRKHLPDAPVANDEETPSHLKSYQLFQAGLSLAEVAQERQLKSITVQDHIIRAISEGQPVQWERIIPPEQEELIQRVIDELGAETLKPIKEALPQEVDYFAIKGLLCKRSLQHV
ncbi:DNA helicase RecQ [Tumebacillus algifaecis]|uniref:DNA helicase RecQ n=1 Tax=Tumebacillus algifaecis TaxID=1214604 RepID=A0A223D725_9BACL|nr:DNA helicase RecQ [Tumebacillus algifaecis]ASS77164.1 DNA helicase RecQ [Tumebacillus algifaecis]